MVIEYKNLKVEDAAEQVIRKLHKEEGIGVLAYASSYKRGEYRGFSALHDLTDANMFLPFVEDDIDHNDELYVNFCNAVMDEITKLLKNGSWIKYIPYGVLELDGLEVGEKVGILPEGTSEFRKFLIGKVIKLTKTTVHVEVTRNMKTFTMVFSRKTGNERGVTSLLFIKSLTHVDNAIKANTKREVSIKKRDLVQSIDVRIAKLSNRLKSMEVEDLREVLKQLDKIQKEEKYQ